ncbi:MAG: hypothetical protein ACREDK_00550 [Thermoplasmata archaeon]
MATRPATLPPPTRPSASAPNPAAPATRVRVPEVRDLGASRHDAITAQRWVAQGTSKVLGEVDVEEATLHGGIAIRGTLTADRVHLDGYLEVEGPTRVAHQLALAGDARFTSDVRAGEMRGEGSIEVGGPLVVAGTLAWTGHLDVRGDVRAAALRFDGRLTVQGNLYADTVEGTLRGASRVQNILAPSIAIDRHAPLFGAKGCLDALRIEGREVRLAGVVAQYLRADRASLGPDCHIARLDGTIVRRHASARVGPESTSPRPYGLRR